MSRFLCLDIETIRDPSVWQPPADQPEAFPPPHGWRPIVIGCCLLDINRNGGVAVERLGVIDVPKTGPADTWEKQLLDRFGAYMRASAVDLVTWNGRRFDLPVLMLRGLRHGVISAWYYGNRDMRYRFSEGGHLDLADAMADFGACSSLGLDGMARLVGLPGKYGDIDGAGVEQAFQAGRHDEIANYCLGDAVQTAFLFLRWQLVKGELTYVEYRTATAALLARCAAEPRLGDFVSRVDHAVLLLDQAGEAAA